MGPGRRTNESDTMPGWCDRNARDTGTIHRGKTPEEQQGWDPLFIGLARPETARCRGGLSSDPVRGAEDRSRRYCFA